MKTLGILFAGLLLLMVAWRPLADVYVAAEGITVDGQVISKREYFAMHGEDRWRHVFEVEYRYLPRDEALPRTVTQPVDAALHDRLQVGIPVKVRYSPWPPLRSVQAVGAVLVGSSWLSRIPFDSDTDRGVVEMVGFAIAATFGFFAYRRRSRLLGWVAGLATAVWISTVMLAGSFVFAVLFQMWRRNPGRGYGVLLLASMALSTFALDWRIPQPPSAIAGQPMQAMAIARQVHRVGSLWGGWRLSGQPIRQPFDMVDLEFRPRGATASVHALDHVDAGSVPGLKPGARVEVVYPASHPRAGRMAAGTRGYARNTLIYLLELTFGIGAALVLVMQVLIHAIGGRVRRSQLPNRMFQREDST